MRNSAALLLAVLTACAAIAGSPAESHAAALLDARRLPPETRKDHRYLDLSFVPARERDSFEKALAFHFHCLSREPDIVPLVKVAPDVVRVYFDDFGWERSVWEKLAPHDVYFHLADPRVVRKVQLDVTGSGTGPQPSREFQERANATVYVFRNGFVEVSTSDVREGEEVYDKVGERQFRRTTLKAPRAAAQPAPRPDLKPERDTSKQVLHAPWLDPKGAVELATLLNSDVPIVRADWFLYWTSSSFRRGGSGYYDFLGLKSLRDAEKLAGLDVEAARKLRLEMAALVDDSGVALNNRQILWFKTLAGSWWQTLDTDESVGRKNALRLYDGDFQADAFEIYFSLPSGVWGLIASGADGKLQETVPDTIASDGRATSNDRRIHNGFSCIRCHTEGIQPIDDWARATYTGPVALASRDPKKLKRLQRLYLSDLPDRVREDNRVYAKTVLKINGLAPKANAEAYASAVTNYWERRLTFDDLCRELGCEPKVLTAALEKYAAPGDADPVLTAQLARIRRPMRREHVEEVYGLAQSILRGARP